jgi:hypothetical protein
MTPVPIHAGPFIAAVLVRIIVGSLWYSPLLFLKEWQRLAGVSDDAMKGGMAKGMATWIIGAIVMTFVLAHAVYYAGAHGPAAGAAVGFFNWLGFILVVHLDSDWARRSVHSSSWRSMHGNTLVRVSSSWVRFSPGGKRGSVDGRTADLNRSRRAEDS